MFSIIGENNQNVCIRNLTDHHHHPFWSRQSITLNNETPIMCKVLDHKTLPNYVRTILQKLNCSKLQLNGCGDKKITNTTCVDL